jgi:hypothetical protein
MLKSKLFNSWRHISAALILYLSGASSAFSAAAYTDAAVTLPATLNPVYVYNCGDDSTCTNQTQLNKNGYVTQVQNWQSAGIAANGQYIYLSLPNQTNYYMLWQTDSSAATGWRGCILVLDQTAGLTSSNNCPSVSQTSPVETTQVLPISIGPAGSGYIADSGVPAGAPAQPAQPPDSVVSVAQRTIKFKNSTQYEICLANKGSAVGGSLYNNQSCNGNGYHDIPSKKSYTHSVSSAGENSFAFAVVGYKKGGTWIANAKDLQATGNPSGTPQYYATQLEWTMWPQYASPSGYAPGGTSTYTQFTDGEGQAEYTVGMSTVDVSNVNGFNIGVTLYPDPATNPNGALCMRSKTEGGSLYWQWYSKNSAMSIFPYNGQSLKQICNGLSTANFGRSYVAHDASGKIPAGCNSDCAMANATNTNVDEWCCIGGSYGTYQSCSAAISVANRPFVSAMHSAARNGYAWAYDDSTGTFTCDPNASFVFEITEVGFTKGGSSPNPPPAGSYNVTPLIGSGSVIIDTASGATLTSGTVFKAASPWAVTVNSLAANINLVTGQVTGAGATGVAVSPLSGSNVTVTFPGP